MGIALLVVASLVGLLALPASAATGSLSGTVSDSSAAPIGGVSVDVFEATWGIPVGSTTTQPDGAYSLPVAPGSYRVRFTHPAHPETWSGNTANWVTSATVTIDDGGTTIEDATMADLDTIEGTVTDPDHNPVAGLTVELLYQGLAYRTTPTATDGTYQFTDVPNATFTLGFRDPTGTTWAMQYSGGSNTAAGATPITTTGGTTHTINHTAHHGGSIKGTNGIGATGPGVAGLYVAAIDTTQFEPLAITTTGTNGTWQIDNLPPGDVTIATIDPAALGATPHTSYRIVFRPERDIDTLGLGTAWTTATRYPITTGTTTPTGRQPLRGHHCNPTTHHPGANLDGSHLTNKDLRGCDIASSQITTQRASGDYVWFCESVFPPPSIWGEFAYANLSGLDLSHLSLSGDFTGANLTGVDLSVSVVSSWADFTGARIAGADLSKTLIDPAKILATDRDWTGTKLSTLRDANDPLCMWWTEFDSIDWSGGGWSLAEADLSGISLTNGNFAGMDLHGLRLSASPSGNWQDVAEIDGSTFAGADLSNAKLMALDFQGVSTDGAILTGADLTNAKNIARRYFAGADLRGTNLTNVALGSANLTNADLTGANLTSTNLYGAGLTGAVLTGVTYDNTVLTNTSLRNRNFSGLSLRSVTFSGADLKNASFANADLTSAKFPGANLNGVTFAGANLTNADLTGANLAVLPTAGATFTGANLTNANLTGKDLTGANLTGTKLTGANLTGANLTGAVLTADDLTGADLTNADLTGADLAGATLTGALLNGANLTDAVLTGASLIIAQASGATFTGATITNASITGANLAGATGLDGVGLLSTTANWTGTNLADTGVSFAGASFNGTTIFNKTLTGADLSRLDLSGATSLWASLTNVNFTGANLTGATFTLATLTGSTFAGATLTGTGFAGARIEAVTFTGAVGLTTPQLLATYQFWERAILAGAPVNLSGADLSLHWLRGIDLSGIPLTGTNLTGRDLTNALLAGADLAGANLTNANLNGATGNPTGGSTAVYANTTCPDGTTASPATAQTTCVGHGMGA